MKENILTRTKRASTDNATDYVPDIFQFVVRREGTIWVFDDPEKNVAGEPFVCGMNEIIDDIVERHGIPAIPGQRIRETFCDVRAVVDVPVESPERHADGVSVLDYHPALNNVPMNYTPYRDSISGLEGAFCEVFLRYFPKGMEPRELLLFPEVEGANQS
jgi:hypothetical protein